MDIFEIPPMRYKKYEITDIAWMEAVIHEAQYATLALATPDGFPYAVPIGFGYERGAFYFHGSKEGFKQLILSSNPRACVNLHTGDELVPGVPSSQYNTRYRSVTAFGKIKTIKDRAAMNHGLATMMDHYKGPHEDIDDSYFLRTWVGKLVVEKMTGKQAGGAAYYSADETAKIVEKIAGHN